jgi:predicted enzyme related to lactoylglutathione lyase
MGYIDVPNVDEYVDKVISAGGALHRGPADVPGMLRFAVFTDPHGAPFILFTPDPAMPANPARPEPPAIGTIGWNELSAGDMKADFDFYASLFGWTVAADMDMGPMGIYRVFNYAGSTSPMGDGGMASLPPNFPSPFWTFYFNVDSTTAAMERITAGGGKVLHGPHQVPGGGWIAQAFDPQGAFFSIVSSEK